MSHFTVMVFGNNQDAQLAPYHEFECTGHNDEYVEDVDMTEEVLAHQKASGDDVEATLEYFGYEDKVFENELDVEEEIEGGRAMYGFAIVQDGKIIKVVNRTNPNAKWDWYVLGGRWAGFFKPKEGKRGKGDKSEEGYYDLIRKGDIDIEGMMQDARNEAYAEYDAVMEIAAGRPLPNWAEIRERHKNDIDIDAARKAYHEDPVTQDLHKARRFFFSDSPGERYGIGREKFAENAAAQVLTTYAYVKDGNWIERGQMGWWGMASNEMNEEEWTAKFMEFFNALPDDTLVGVYDCHI